MSNTIETIRDIINKRREKGKLRGPEAIMSLHKKRLNELKYDGRYSSGECRILNNDRMSFKEARGIRADYSAY